MVFTVSFASRSPWCRLPRLCAVSEDPPGARDLTFSLVLVKP